MKTLANIILHLSLSLVFAQNSIVYEDLTLINDSIQLPGTLSLDSRLKSQPLIIFIQGSGNPDRNGNQLDYGVKANYIKQLRDSINQKEIAFYSYDKRNVTTSNIPLFVDDFSFEMLVEDAQVAINHFSNDQRFNQLILIGHSQGSLVAMLACNDSIAKYVSLAGIGESVDNTIIRQLSAQSPELGEIAKNHFKELKETGTIAETNPMLAAVFAPVNLKFLESYMKYEPSEVIKTVEQPILIINGDKDLQVEIKDAQYLHEGNKDSELVIIKNMNHVLKTIENEQDNQASYFSEGFPLSNELVNQLVAFIKK